MVRYHLSTINRETGKIEIPRNKIKASQELSLVPRGTRKNSKKQAEKNGSGDLPLLQLAQADAQRL